MYEDNSISIITFAEILGKIDHKVRGLQQLILALTELTEDDSLVDSFEELMKGTKDLQSIYRDLLKIRRIDIEDINADEYFANHGIKSPLKCNFKADSEKLDFIINTIKKICESDVKIFLSKETDNIVLGFRSDRLSGISENKTRDKASVLNSLNLYAIERITQKMDGKFEFKDNIIKIKLPCGAGL